MKLREGPGATGDVDREERRRLTDRGGFEKTVERMPYIEQRAAEPYETPPAALQLAERLRMLGWHVRVLISRGPRVSRSTGEPLGPVDAISVRAWRPTQEPAAQVVPEGADVALGPYERAVALWYRQPGQAWLTEGAWHWWSGCWPTRIGIRALKGRVA